MEKQCKNCRYCRIRVGNKGPVFSCNVGGMMATTEKTLPKHCDRWARKEG